VIAGVIIATVFVIDQMMSVEAASNAFPFLHTKYTIHFGFRGLWAEILITGILFGVSAFTPKTAPDKLEKTTANYSGKITRFEGFKDWRLYLVILSAITLALWIWLY